VPWPPAPRWSRQKEQEQRQRQRWRQEQRRRRRRRRRQRQHQRGDATAAGLTREVLAALATRLLMGQRASMPVRAAPAALVLLRSVAVCQRRRRPPAPCRHRRPQCSAPRRGVVRTCPSPAYARRRYPLGVCLRRRRSSSSSSSSSSSGGSKSGLFAPQRWGAPSPPRWRDAHAAAGTTAVGGATTLGCRGGWP